MPAFVRAAKSCTRVLFYSYLILLFGKIAFADLKCSVANRLSLWSTATLALDSRSVLQTSHSREAIPWPCGAARRSFLRAGAHSASAKVLVGAASASAPSNPASQALM